MKKMLLKTIQLFTLMISSALIITACGSQSTNNGESHEGHNHAAEEKEEVSEKTLEAQAAVANFETAYANADNTLAAYMVLKDALVATNAELAQKAAGKLAELSEGEVKSAAEGIAASTDVKEQRNLFNTISQQMYESLKADGAEATVYKQYCPMAFNNEGAYWLSTEEKIMNPYFGDIMLNCGRVDETFQASTN